MNRLLKSGQQARRATKRPWAWKGGQAWRPGLLLAAWLAAPALWAGIPGEMNYQGRLLSKLTQNPVPDSTGNTMAFFIVDSSGNTLWSESHLGDVATKSGLFNVVLGSVNPITGLAFDQPYWLSIQANGEQMAPNQPLVTAPYAFNAQGADTASTALKLSLPAVLTATGAVVGAPVLEVQDLGVGSAVSATALGGTALYGQGAVGIEGLAEGSGGGVGVVASNGGTSSNLALSVTGSSLFNGYVTFNGGTNLPGGGGGVPNPLSLTGTQNFPNGVISASSTGNGYGVEGFVGQPGANFSGMPSLGQPVPAGVYGYTGSSLSAGVLGKSFSSVSRSAGVIGLGPVGVLGMGYDTPGGFGAGGMFEADNPGDVGLNAQSANGTGIQAQGVTGVVASSNSSLGTALVAYNSVPSGLALQSSGGLNVMYDNDAYGQHVLAVHQDNSSNGGGAIYGYSAASATAAVFGLSGDSTLPGVGTYPGAGVRGQGPVGVSAATNSPDGIGLMANAGTGAAATAVLADAGGNSSNVALHVLGPAVFDPGTYPGMTTFNTYVSFTAGTNLGAGGGVPNPLALANAVSGPVISASNTGTGAAVVAAGTSIGLSATAGGSTGIAVYGRTDNSSGAPYAAVVGLNDALNTGIGVYGSSGNIGVEGSGTTYGVYGTVGSFGNAGVYGLSLGTPSGLYGDSELGYGVYGLSSGSGLSGAAVFGSNTNSGAYGVYGSGGSVGVYGTGGNVGVSGTSSTGVGMVAQGVTGVVVSAVQMGVSATASGPGAVGVLGDVDSSAYGVVGRNESSLAGGTQAGVYGYGYQGYGVFGESQYGHGVYGLSHNSDGINGVTGNPGSAGVVGNALGTSGEGVLGQGPVGVEGQAGSAGSGGVGVLAMDNGNPSNLALHVMGNGLFDSAGNTVTFNSYVNFTGGTNLGAASVPNPLSLYNGLTSTVVGAYNTAGAGLTAQGSPALLVLPNSAGTGVQVNAGTGSTGVNIVGNGIAAGVVAQGVTAVVASGSSIGVSATSSSYNGYAVYGEVNSVNFALEGFNNNTSSTGGGVIGSGQGLGYGVYGESASGAGVYGTSANGPGLEAAGGSAGLTATASSGDAVYGLATGTGSYQSGVHGIGGNGGWGFGVRGDAGSGTNGNAGVVGTFGGPTGFPGGIPVTGSGVLGYNTASNGGGVSGYAPSGTGVYAEGANGMVAFASQPNGVAVYASNTAGSPSNGGAALLVNGLMEVSSNSISDGSATSVPSFPSFNVPAGQIQFTTAKNSISSYGPISDSYVTSGSVILVTFVKDTATYPYSVYIPTAGGSFSIVLGGTATFSPGSGLNFVVINP